MTAAPPSDPARGSSHLGDGVRRSQSEAGDAHEREIGQVVAHDRGFGRFHAKPGYQSPQQGFLVGDTLVHLDDPELAHPAGHRRRGAARYDRDLDAGAPRGLYRQPVMDVEALDLLARSAIDQDAIREDAVHVEDQEPDPGGPAGGVPRGRLPLHTILALRIAWMLITPDGWPKSSVMARLVMTPFMSASA